MKIGICVGHSRAGDRGAVSIWGEAEWDYNSKVATFLHQELTSVGIDSFIIDDYNASGYSTAIRRCAKMLRDRGATHALELHFNAAGPSANGAEWLHWHSSKGGKALAQAVHDGFTESFPNVTDRGLKPRHPGQRGTAFLRTTHCPALILEPFFGTNEKDSATFQGNEQGLAKAYSAGIQKLSPHC